MYYDTISIYSIPFIGVLLIIVVLSLPNTRHMFTYKLHNKRKKRHSINDDTNYLKNSYMKIQMNPFTYLDTIKYIRNGISIPLEDDDDELIKSEIVSKFTENNTIELRLEQDFDSDNDADNEK